MSRLKSILVRTSATPAVVVAPGQLGGEPAQPAGPWETSLELYPAATQFDYKVVLTDKVEDAGLPVEVTVSSASVTLTRSGRVTVPHGASDVVVTGNWAEPSQDLEQVVTLTATGPAGRIATAELTIMPLGNIQ
jgi:hypothetical protein